MGLNDDYFKSSRVVEIGVMVMLGIWGAVGTMVMFLVALKIWLEVAVVVWLKD